MTYWFSYETCIAFQGSGSRVVCENDWGPTTGKHINSISYNKDERLPREEFERELSRAMAGSELQELERAVRMLKVNDEIKGRYERLIGEISEATER